MLITLQIQQIQEFHVRLRFFHVNAFITNMYNNITENLHIMKLRLYLLIPLLTWALSGMGTVKLHAIFSDNMVLQRDHPITIWGTADPGEHISAEFRGKVVKTTANENRTWTVSFPKQKANHIGADMIIQGNNRIVLHNILIGDVWLCSGQSNMEMALGACNDSISVNNADFPSIRYIRVPYTCADKPMDDVKSKLNWVICSPQTASACSAVGFYFARRLANEVKVPIGILISSIGGTNIEKWMPQASFASNPHLNEYNQKIEAWMKQYRQDVSACQEPLRKWLDSAQYALDNHTEIPSMPYIPIHPSLPGSRYGGGDFSHLYNGMISPFSRFKIKGAIWYQGENNGEERESYCEKMCEMISIWRKIWGYDFPFYFVQLSSWLEPTKDPNKTQNGWQHCREAQVMCFKKMPHTGIAASYDIGDANDIHPKNKYDVGERLAVWALTHDYNRKYNFCGPIYKSMKIVGDKIYIDFDYAEEGLMIGNKTGQAPVEEIKSGLNGFAIAGDDKIWHWADATIIDGKVVVSSSKVKNPIAVRYAYSMNPQGANLYDKGGLPALPFRTDCW